MPNEQIKIEGTVLALIYKNDESGYAVARVMLDDGSQLTIVGIMPYLGAGERIEAIGALVNHPQHGSQLSVQSYERQMPRGRVGIYEYLASRVIKGVGPKTARAMSTGSAMRLLRSWPSGGAFAADSGHYVGARQRNQSVVSAGQRHALARRVSGAVRPAGLFFRRTFEPVG